MIQELFGGVSANNSSTGLLGERKISIPFSSLSSSPLLSATSTITTTPSTTTLVNSSNSPASGGNNNNNNNPEANNSQNLRCPRCDSTNTKFCYYNNYNLTQPRHFCKTCRRYWTKGGTLRNVPIGGGCRKNKTGISTSSSATSAMCKSSSNPMAKAKATLSSEMLVNDNSLFLGNGFMDHQLQPNGSNSNPMIWAQAQNSHILALLRGASPFSNPNPNPSPNPTSNLFTSLKTEGPTTTTTTTLGLDSYSYGNNGSSPLQGSFSRSNPHQLNGFASGVSDYAQNNGNSNILDLYQRLKSSSNYGYCGNENPGTVTLGNMIGSTPASSAMNSTVFDAATLGGGESMGGYSFMSPPAMSSWSEFPAVPINGAFH